MQADTIIDIHCHPTIKPYGKSFRDHQKNSQNPQKKNSIWFRDKPNFVEKLLNRLTSLTRYTQSDFETLIRADNRIVFTTLYPFERGFFDVPKFGLGQGFISDLLLNFVVGIGDQRIDFVQKNRNYFQDLEAEYNFLKSLEGKLIELNGNQYTYKIAKNFADLEESKKNHRHTVFNVLSIEGAHVFNDYYDPENKPAEQRADDILQNVYKVKNWGHPPFFISLAHHFYNELCGQEKSLKGIVDYFLGANQALGLGDGITKLGYQVIEKLLDPTSGKRIYIDVKHMSIKARQEYYDWLKSYNSEGPIPIIISHGSVNGFKKPGEVGNSEEVRKQFQGEAINFFDFELIELQKSGGVFGLQLDERRIASPEALKKLNRENKKKNNYLGGAKLVWRQIQHIAEVLDQAELPAWDAICIGSDYDGIINPINGYWNAESFQLLKENLMKLADQYLNSSPHLKQSQNLNISSQEIVDKIFHKNAYQFLAKYF